MYTTRRNGFDIDDARMYYKMLQKDRYVLTLHANNGQTAVLTYDSMDYALSMKQAFMSTGEYNNATVTMKD